MKQKIFRFFAISFLIYTLMYYYIDVLKISAGHIMLDGYDYGFIGGCCGKISSGAIAFCGDLKTHPDSDNICGFLGNYGIKAVSLGSGQLYDTGGILPIA